MWKLSIATLLVLIASGCASSTGVIPIGQDTFMISRRGSSGFTSTGSIKAECFQEANEFCLKAGKQLQAVHSQESPAWPGHLPTAEIQFMCLSTNDPEFKRPKMIPDPSQVIEIRK